MASVLSISAGTRGVGIAVFIKGDLRDWQVKTFKGAWSTDKQTRILKTLRQLIATHAISALAIKVPHKKRSSQGTDDLIASLQKFCENENIPFFRYTIKELKQSCDNEVCNHIQDLIQHVTKLYPEVFHLYHSQTRRIPYYLKLFEAICAGNCYLKHLESKPI